MDISFLQSSGGFELTFGARKREHVQYILVLSLKKYQTYTSIYGKCYALRFKHDNTLTNRNI